MANEDLNKEEQYIKILKKEKEEKKIK